MHSSKCSTFQAWKQFVTGQTNMGTILRKNLGTLLRDRWSMYEPFQALCCHAWTFPSTMLPCLNLSKHYAAMPEPFQALCCHAWAFPSTMLPCLNLSKHYAAIPEPFQALCCHAWTFPSTMLPCLSLSKHYAAMPEPFQALCCHVWIFPSTMMPCLNLSKHYAAISSRTWKLETIWHTGFSPEGYRGMPTQQKKKPNKKQKQKQNWHRQHMHCLSICILLVLNSINGSWSTYFITQVSLLLNQHGYKSMSLTFKCRKLYVGLSISRSLYTNEANISE